jgi:hypothetical protein
MIGRRPIDTNLTNATKRDKNVCGWKNKDKNIKFLFIIFKFNIYSLLFQRVCLKMLQ